MGVNGSWSIRSQPSLVLCSFYIFLFHCLRSNYIQTKGELLAHHYLPVRPRIRSTFEIPLVLICAGSASLDYI